MEIIRMKTRLLRLLFAFILTILFCPNWAPADDGAGDDFGNLLDQSSGSVPNKNSTTNKNLNSTEKFEGEFRPSVWYELREPHDFKAADRVDMLAEKGAGGFSFQARFRADYQNLDRDEEVTADLRELYGQYRINNAETGALSFSVGRKIVYWGKGDEIRPIDRVCPEDLTTFLYYDKNERKTGIPGLFFDGSTNSGVKIETFWSPLFNPSKMPEKGGYFEPPRLAAFSDAGGKVLEEEDEWTWKNDASMGIRLSFPVLSSDVSLYAWRGLDPAPGYRISKFVTMMPVPQPPYYVDIPPTPVEIAYNHPMAVVFGADFEETAGDFVLRGEAAYQSEGAFMPVKYSSDPMLLLRFPVGLEEKQKGQFLLGIDRNDFIFRNLFVNIQYLAEFIPEHKDYLDADELSQGFTLTLKYSALDSRINAMWRLFTYLDSNERQNQLELSYKPFGWGQLTAGAFFYDGGTVNDILGQFNNKDFVFLRASFIM